MAGAYAALVSLNHLLEQIQLYNTRYGMLRDEQLRKIESLCKKTIFLQVYLETYSNGGGEEARAMESLIVNAAYAAEDLIESYIVDDIHVRSLDQKSFPISANCEKFNHFNNELHKTMDDMDFIVKEVTRFKEKSRVNGQRLQDPTPVVFQRPSSAGKQAMVGFDKELNQIMKKLTGHQSNLQVIPISGMGGIGKTTLAKNVYDNTGTVKHFDIHGWMTISQEFQVEHSLSLVLQEFGLRNDLNESREYHHLGEKLYKHLSGRRYLIVMDDMWDLGVWDKLKLFLPDNNNGSRIIVTTRLSDVARNFNSSYIYELNLLHENESWSLICRTVFVHERFRPELEDIGKNIARKCGGLPLAIAVVGGLLAKSNMTLDYWKYVAEHMNTTIHSEEDDDFSKILYLSYRHLPIHLKPCFLYMGVFPEDYEFRASELIKLWVAEGFLKPSRSKGLEEVARNNLNDLVDRNLIIVSKFGGMGNMKFCKIHDLLRDLCLREAHKEKFLYTNATNDSYISQDMGSLRRISVFSKSGEDPPHVSDALQSAPFARSLTCELRSRRLPRTELDFDPTIYSRLLRVMNVDGFSSTDAIFQLVNMRYLCCYWSYSASKTYYPSSISLLWNLETIIVKISSGNIVAPSEIWEMPQLRHLIIDDGVFLPDPPIANVDGKNELVMENLQTLSSITGFRCTEEVSRRIPNIKKLKLQYLHAHDQGLSHYGLNNISRLHELKSLACTFMYTNRWPTRFDFLQNFGLPTWLKKLYLCNCNLHWEDLAVNIGSLPHLEKLILNAIIGEQWDPVEEQFISLKFLHISTSGLKCWTVDNTNFPVLEHVVLSSMWALKEFPSGIGEIETLRSIRIKSCNGFIVASAKNTLEEQRSFGNEDLQLLV